MTFNLIGLGLNENSISVDALKILDKCDKIYLENYTVNFPYSKEKLETNFKIKIAELDRSKVEDESIVEEAKEKDVALLVYGDSLSATTHIQLILACKKQNINYQIFHNASIMTAIAETGLQLYRFGKTTSMPNWKEHTNKPTSYANYIKENLSISAHTLILTDIGLNLNNTIKQLKESINEIKIEKIIVCSNIGTKNQKIFYETPENLENKEVEMPFCLIIPAELNHVEEEAIKELANQ